MSLLINDAYVKFGDVITNEMIDKLRLKHRLRVVSGYIDDFFTSITLYIWRLFFLLLQYSNTQGQDRYETPDVCKFRTTHLGKQIPSDS